MDKIKNSMFLRLFIFICFFFQMNCYYFQNTHFLISAKLNGTSPVVSLNQLKPKSNYVNFIFDFFYHSNAVPESKNTAYFKISTNLDIPEDDISSENSIKFRFFEDNWTKIIKKQITKNLEYHFIKFISKEENKVNDKLVYTYKFKIEKQNEKDNTLLIKVPTQNKNEGFISIENVLT